MNFHDNVYVQNKSMQQFLSFCVRCVNASTIRDPQILTEGEVPGSFVCAQNSGDVPGKQREVHRLLGLCVYRSTKLNSLTFQDKTKTKSALHTIII